MRKRVLASFSKKLSRRALSSSQSVELKQLSLCQSKSGGGLRNEIRTAATNHFYSAIGRGYDNAIAATSTHATIAGGGLNAITAPNPLPARLAGAGKIESRPTHSMPRFPGTVTLPPIALFLQALPPSQHTGTFVWADSQDADFVSSGTNQFLIRAEGGVGIGTSDPKARL